MRKSILTLGITAILTGVLATCSMAYAADDELSQIQESGKLKVGVEGTYPPYTYHDDDGDDLYVLFESAAYAYSAASVNIVDRVLKLSIPKMEEYQKSTGEYFQK